MSYFEIAYRSLQKHSRNDIFHGKLQFFLGNFLPHKTVVLSVLRFMEIKFPILETHIDILINNALNRGHIIWSRQGRINTIQL